MTERPSTPDRELLDRIAEDFDHEPDVVLGTMFRSPGLRVGGKVFAFLGHHGQLIVKLPSGRANQLVDEGTAEHVVMGQRRMREWIAFPSQDDRTATLTLWRRVAQEAHHYVDHLRRQA
jgi:hypothetical protein